MHTTSRNLKNIINKLSPKQRVVLIYAYGLDNSYPKSIEQIASMFGNNEKYILENLKNTYKKFPNEISQLLNLKKYI